jgi:uncharacterized protein (DUF2252 family)
VKERLTGKKTALPRSKRFWALTGRKGRALEELFAGADLPGLFCGLKEDAASNAELLDAAFWVKGCGSLGRLRYAVLLKAGPKTDRRMCLVDIKEVPRATVPHREQKGMPADPALRIVAGARTLSPQLGERMVGARLAGRPVAIRELSPHDLKIELGRLTPEQAAALAAYLAGVLGRAHGRQLDRDQRRGWAAEIGCPKPAAGPPAWLWSSVVELLAIHEAAYLEHCRSCQS